jgi:hypothetical protein
MEAVRQPILSMDSELTFPECGINNKNNRNNNSSTILDWISAQHESRLCVLLGTP